MSSVKLNMPGTGSGRSDEFEKREFIKMNPKDRLEEITNRAPMLRGYRIIDSDLNAQSDMFWLISRVRQLEAALIQARMSIGPMCIYPERAFERWAKKEQDLCTKALTTDPVDRGEG